jgi:rod shape-determining protein MreD
MGVTTRGITLTVLFLGLLIAQFAIRPILDWRAEIDFLVIALLLVAVRVRPGSAALIGCLAGLVVDALSPLGFGAGAMAGTLVGFAASWSKSIFFADQMLLHGLFFVAGKLAMDLLYLTFEGRLAGGALVMQFVTWTPLSALATALVGVTLLLLVRPLLDPSERRW